MSDQVKEISQVIEEFGSVSELHKQNKQLFNQLKKAHEELQQKSKELEHLKSVVMGSGLVPHNIPPEQLICEMEILRLQKTTQERELTRDEVYKFDTLVNDLIKIKRLQHDLKGQEDDHKVELSEEDLLKIVKDGN